MRSRVGEEAAAEGTARPSLPAAKRAMGAGTARSCSSPRRRPGSRHTGHRLILQVPGAGGVVDVGLGRRAEGGAVERGGRLEGRERARDAVVALGRRGLVTLVTLVVRRRGRRVVSRGVVGRPEVQRGPAQRRHRSIQKE